MAPWQRVRAGERGQALTEYAGTALVASVILMVVVAAAWGASGGQVGETLVCKVSTAVHSLDGGHGGNSACGQEQSGDGPAEARYAAVSPEDSGSPGDTRYSADPGSIPSHVEEESSGQSLGVGVPVGPGQLGVTVGDDKTSTKTTNMDGSGQRRQTRTSELSAGFRMGASKSSKKKSGDGGKEPLSVVMEAEGTVGLSKTDGEIYECGSAGQLDCPELDKKLKEQQRNSRPPVPSAVGAAGIVPNTTPPGASSGKGNKNEVRPDRTFSAWNFSVKVSGSASYDPKASASSDDNDKSGGTDGEGGADKAGDPRSKVGVSAALNVSGEVAFTRTETKNPADGTSTTNNRFSYQGSADVVLSLNSAASETKEKGGSGSSGSQDEEPGASTVEEDAFGGSVGGGGTYYASYDVTYDENGRLSKITFVNIVEKRAGGDTSGSSSSKADGKGGGAPEKSDKGASGGGGEKDSETVAVTTTLDVSSLSDEERAIAENYASFSYINGALVVPRSALKPSEPSDAAFDNLLYEKAQTTRVTQDGATVTEEGGLDAWIIKYEHHSTESTKDTSRVQQLGSPGPDGRRSYEDVDLP